MNRKMKTIILSTIVVVSIVLIFMLSKNNRSLSVPNTEELSSITLVDVVNEKGSEKTTISKKTDISRLLEILKNSERTNKESISDFPSKTQFTTVLFKFKSGGNSFRSIYEDNNSFYIDQPYEGIFKIESKDIYMLDEIKKNGSKENIVIPISDIIKGNF